MAPAIAQGAELGVTTAGAMGSYTIRFVKQMRAMGLKVQMREDLHTRRLAGYFKPPMTIALDPNVAHRGEAYHEYRHYIQFKTIARGNIRVDRAMYNDNPDYFEMLAQRDTYNWLRKQPDVPEFYLQAHYQHWQEHYERWMASGGRVPRYEDYATPWEKLRGRLFGLW